MILHIYCADTVTVFEDILFQEFNQLKHLFNYNDVLTSVANNNICYTWVYSQGQVNEVRQALKAIRLNNKINNYVDELLS